MEQAGVGDCLFPFGEKYSFKMVIVQNSAREKGRHISLLFLLFLVDLTKNSF